MNRITEEQAAAIAANAPSRQVRRALQRRIVKHNHHVDWQEEMTVKRHQLSARHRERFRERSQQPLPSPGQKYPPGEDKRHDKYLHAGARVARALRLVGLGA